MVFFFTGCAALFYFLNIPVRARVTFRAGTPAIVTFGVGVFTSTRIIEKEFSLSIDRLIDMKGKYPSRSSLDGWLPMVKYAFHHLSELKITGKVSLGTGDAAETAQLCGLLASIRSTILQVVPGSVNFTIEPDFSHSHFYVRAGGMVVIKLGHIMGALSKGAFARKSRRVQYAASH